MRSFVVVGQAARASDDFSLDDLPSTSGRLDVLLRCVRAALLFSHGLRRGARIYLVLRGGPSAPRVLRVEGALAKFVRPDERSLALLVKKTLGFRSKLESSGFVEVRPGVAMMQGDLDGVLEDLGSQPHYLLEESAPDLRSHALEDHAAFWIGDHLGFDDETRQKLVVLGAHRVSVGPMSLHSDDVVAVLSNELDRRALAL